MSHPLIAVVIPTFRRPESLRSALNSVGLARRKADVATGDLEVVVVDDGHDENTRQICEAANISSPVMYLRSGAGPRAGPSASRNQGIQAATGSLIYLLDDDDAYLPNRFFESLRLLTSNRYDVVLETSLREYDDGSGKSSFITGPYGNPDNAFRFLVTGGPRSHVTPGATAFRKDVFVKIGGYDETLRYGEDGELLLRLCLYGKVALVEGAPVVRISIHRNNTSRPDRPVHWASVLFLTKLYRKMRRAPFPDETQLIRRVLSDKLDFALTRCRETAPSYWRRIAEGAKILRCFDWRCTTFNNFRSMGVWLIKPS